MAALALLAAGCRSAPEEEAPPTVRQLTEELIATNVSGTSGFGDVTATCPDVSAVGVGSTWDCLATTDDQRILALTATIDELGLIQVTTTNVITDAALPSFERAAVDALNATVQTTLNYEAINCGDTTVVFTPDPAQPRTMICALFDPLTERTFDVTLTIEDIEARQFSLVVADDPRA